MCLAIAIVGVMVMSSCIPGSGLGPAVKRIEAASKLLARAVATNPSMILKESFEDVHTWQLKHEAPVPTICLTSPADVVVREAGVRDYAAALQAAQPKRQVSVVSLKGNHCQLVKVDRDEYARHVDAWLERAQYVHLMSEAGGKGLCAYGLAVRERMVLELEKKIIARGEPLPEIVAAAARAAKKAESAAPVDISDHVPAPSPTPTTDSITGKSTSTEENNGWSPFLEKHSLQSACKDTPLRLGLGEAFAVLESDGRTALLAKLKEAGVSALPLRQKLANALGKEVRLQRGPDA